MNEVNEVSMRLQLVDLGELQKLPDANPDTDVRLVWGRGEGGIKTDKQHLNY